MHVYYPIVIYVLNGGFKGVDCLLTCCSVVWDYVFMITILQQDMMSCSSVQHKQHSLCHHTSIVKYVLGKLHMFFSYHWTV